MRYTLFSHPSQTHGLSLHGVQASDQWQIHGAKGAIASPALHDGLQDTILGLQITSKTAAGALPRTPLEALTALPQTI